MSEERPSQRNTHDLMSSIDHFFQSTFKRFPHQLFPQPIPIRVSEEPEAFIVEADLAGTKKEQIELEIIRQTLVIRVHAQNEITTLDEDTHAISKESSQQIRERSISVPFVFEESDVKTKYSNGLLTVTIAGTRKKISIT
ncbi:Hsp20/alpha crystallin family protein [Shouchella shacheensis]|uniref:Hsp20/alpha crystallin family protein n=1 Tax=Shouchella shacheensis TaxID=1649580 RepID=UPI000740043B|nr:Hsp20/alpha crystallin family protein [Shouchella shacheensis]